jgi:hypothetical protein
MTPPPASLGRDLPVAKAGLVLIAWFVLATVVVGWWGVPVVGFVWAWWAARHQRLQIPVAVVAAGGAVLAWGALLAWGAVGGALGRLTHALGVLTRIPGAALIALTLAFGALLAWAAAALVDSGD